jgi:hypothetical protein
VPRLKLEIGLRHSVEIGDLDRKIRPTVSIDIAGDNTALEVPGHLKQEEHMESE